MYTEQKYKNTACKCVGPTFHDEIKDPIKSSKAYFSNFGHKFVDIRVSEHFSFPKITHPPDRCGISRN
jgi:hypothetical protein